MKRVLMIFILGMFLISFVVAENNYNTSCEIDNDCLIANGEGLLDFSCCSSCTQEDYDSDKFIAVNKDWINSEREKYNEENCIGGIMCPHCASSLPFNFDNYVAKCVDNECMKVSVKETPSLCITEADCEVIFSNCVCKYVCSIKTTETLIDCARACSMQERDNEIPTCSCENGKCINNYKTLTQIQKVIRVKNKLKIQPQIQECPEDCTCTGSVIKCKLENGGREMTIMAGKSGNMIVQVKGINMSTNVTLYKSEGKIYGVFKNNQTKEIKILPDEVKEKIRQRIKARLENYNITLDEDGVYQVQMKKRARLFYLIPVREKVKSQIHSETGEIIKIRNSWWGFLARDVEETSEELEQETEGQASVDEIVE